MAAYHSPKIVTSGLVLCLDAANTKSYPGSGTTWTDLSNNKKNGSLLNGPTFSSTNGGVLDFDGTNDHVNLGNASNFISPSQSTFTINSWVKTNVVSTYKKIFSTINSGTQTITGVYFSLGPSPDFVYIGFLTSTSTKGVSYNVNITTSRFYNICGTYDGANIRLYIDGNQVASTTHTGTIGTSGIARISGYDNNGETWSGSIAQVSIYNIALTAAEVQQNFNALRGRFGI